MIRQAIVLAFVGNGGGAVGRQLGTIISGAAADQLQQSLARQANAG